MSKLNYTELFYSIQGEGRYQGVPSIFLRTFGCNFRCRNFGRNKDDSSHNQEVITIIKNIDHYTKFENLPLVSTGCDSYSSVYPEFKSFVTHSNTDSIVTKILDLLPTGYWQDEHLVITGGEPLLGWQRSYPDLLSHEFMSDLNHITFETNGTQKLSDDFYKYLQSWLSNGDREITFSVSAKLPNSGESWSDAIKPDVVCQYQELGYAYLKLVVATEEDIEDADKADREFRTQGFVGPTYLMPVGGVNSVYNLNTKNVALAAMKRGWRYSARLQCDLFKNEWGT